MFAQDKWQRNNLTLNMGVRYDLENRQIDNANNPLFSSGNYAVDKNNVAPRLGVTWQPGGSTTSLIRGGYGIFFDKVTLQTTTPFVSTGVFSDSFTANFPTSAADPGPSSGRFPTDPMLVNGPVVNRAIVNALFRRDRSDATPGTGFSTTPIARSRRPPDDDRLSARAELSRWRSTSTYVHSWNRDQLINFDLNPAQRVDTTRTGRLVYTDLLDLAEQLGISPFVNPVLTRRTTVRRSSTARTSSLEKRFSNRWQARVSYAIGYARGNSEANQTTDNNYQVLGDANLDANFGPLDADRRQNLTVSGRLEIPHTRGLTVSGVYR